MAILDNMAVAAGGLTGFLDGMNYYADQRRQRDLQGLQFLAQQEGLQVTPAQNAERAGILSRMFGKDYRDQGNTPVVSIGRAPFTVSRTPTIGEANPELVNTPLLDEGLKNYFLSAYNTRENRAILGQVLANMSAQQRGHLNTVGMAGVNAGLQTAQITHQGEVQKGVYGHNIGAETAEMRRRVPIEVEAYEGKSNVDTGAMQARVPIEIEAHQGKSDVDTGAMWDRIPIEEKLLDFKHVLAKDLKLDDVDAAKEMALFQEWIDVRGDRRKFMYRMKELEKEGDIRTGIELGKAAIGAQKDEAAEHARLVRAYGRLTKSTGVDTLGKPAAEATVDELKNAVGRAWTLPDASDKNSGTRKLKTQEDIADAIRRDFSTMYGIEKGGGVDPKVLEDLGFDKNQATLAAALLGKGEDSPEAKRVRAQVLKSLNNRIDMLARRLQAADPRLAKRAKEIMDSVRQGDNASTLPGDYTPMGGGAAVPGRTGQSAPAGSGAAPSTDIDDFRFIGPATK